MRRRQGMRIRPETMVVGVLLACAVAVGGCGGSTASPASRSSPASVAPSAPASPSRSAAVPPSATAVAVAPSPTVEPEPTGDPQPTSPPETDEPVVLDPELCPATLPPASYVTDDGIRIAGDEAFIAHAERALALLEERAPEPYAEVLENVVLLRQVESFSGMCYDTGTYRVGEITAHAPGHPVEAQVVWLAGTIVHDGCHRDRFVADLVPGGRDGELACLIEQVAALRLIEDGTFFGDYVQGLADTIDDPASQYWNDPNRHW